MPKNLVSTVENQFIQGLITEATGLNFPEKAVIDTWNCKFLKTGEVVRRKGIEFEDSYVLQETDGTPGAVKEFVWKAIGKNSDTSFLVLQRGSGISFFEVSASVGLSTGLKDFSVDLTTYKVAGATDAELEEKPCDFDAGDGRLFIVHPHCNPLYVRYDSDTDDITITEITIQIRDFEGVEDGLPVDERPATISNLHRYNLYNQGWYPNQPIIGRHGALYPNPIAAWDAIGFSITVGEPSNADVWWYYKSPDENGQLRLNGAGVAGKSFGNSHAPKGHYIFDAFDMDRSAVSGVANVPGKSSHGARPSCCAFFAGRIWYAGVDNDFYSSNLYFSQIIRTDTEAGKCYQLNDPTNEDLSDLLDTDGGVIRIIEGSGIIKLVAIQSALLVFTKNGVWSITGSGAQGTGFVATDFAVNKVSGVPAVSQLNFVKVEGYPIWWNYYGIYTILPSQTATGFEVNSLTQDTIQTFYQEFFAESIKYAKGAYNPSTRIIQWVFRSNAADLFIQNYDYDRMLNFSVLTKAFYPWRIIQSTTDLPTPVIRGIFCLDIGGVDHALENVVDSTDEIVTDSADANVQVNVNIVGSTFTPTFKYTTEVPEVVE